MLLYPVYAVLFAETGLSAAEISSLFIIWSVVSFALEVPSGVLADLLPRRLLLTAAPLLTGAGYALWTFAPSYPAFTLGFVLWGAGGALRSGTLQALVYEELARAGAADGYARLIGRSQAIGTTAAMAATGLAAPALAVGGYEAVGIASIAVTLLGAAAGLSFPESSGPASEQGDTYVQVLRNGFAEVRRAPPVRGCLALVAVLMGIGGALEEYVPLLARSTGVGTSAVPLPVLLVAAGMAVGGWLAGRGTRWAAPALAVAAGCLAAGAASGHPAGLLPIAVAFGVSEWAIVAAEARLQERITDRARATITSMAGFGAEVVAVLTYASYALGSVWAGPGPLFALAAVPYLVLALALWRTR
ncbi:putative MFS family arabinose efflux permease [Spinactinospora alkalitolerans]|uniref:Putative MFS family arabinose efflux permease n=1 Tax=Spinactinospora alkalitolerans TaxID=687207 RepID=A0A852TRP1_9ACTN|nr:MFS transporter [Spinactinospora alkalitolerans]NYE45363.1 putative MFS family arabinose efflux permease [Spinactinospora alkalitolerans]